MQLVVQTGPDAGKVFNLDRPLLILGRQLGSDLLLSDAQISRRHIQLELRDGQVFVSDLGSANGTTVNGLRLMPNQPRPLFPGDLVRLGDTSLSAQQIPMMAQPAMPEAPQPGYSLPTPGPTPYYNPSAPPQPPAYYPPQGFYYNQPQPGYPANNPGYNQLPYVAPTPRKTGNNILIPGLVALLVAGGLLLGLVAVLGVISNRNLNAVTSVQPGTVGNNGTPLTPTEGSAPATPTVLRGQSGTNQPPPSPPALTSLGRPAEIIGWVSGSGRSG